jgi:putative tryptophan/tyrosine transport system substrate-binding protein
MRRREFITFLGGAALARPHAARAQQPAMPVVGFLGNTSGEKFSAAFLHGLPGRNLTIEYRWAEGQYDRGPALAADLVARHVAVLVTATLPLALAAKGATRTIPIVFTMGDDPVKFGIVASLNRPGSNVTGISFISPSIEAKRVELLHELVPVAHTIAALVNPKFPSAEVRESAVRSAASA